MTGEACRQYLQTYVALRRAIVARVLRSSLA